MAKATNAKGLTICFSKGAATPTSVTPTAISKAKPAVVTVASVSTLAAGMIAAPIDTGFPELDGKLFAVGNIDGTGNTFTLLGSDTTNSTATLGAAPTINVTLDADMVCPCFSEFTINRDPPDSIDAGTFCDPSLQVASAAAAAGTFEFSGNIDVSEPSSAATIAYTELLAAEADGLERELRIGVPGNNGYILAPITITLISWEFALDQPNRFTGAGQFSSKPTHAY